MRRTMTAVGLGLAMTAALAGCGDEKDAGSEGSSEETSATASTGESDTASESASTDASSATEEPTDTATPVVTVVDAGEAPGQLLELELEEGHHETSVMRMRQSMTISGMPRQDMPEISMTMGTTVVDVTDEGYVSETTYEDVQVEADGQPRDLVRTLDEALSVLEGLTGTMTTAPNGAVLASEFDIPADADPMMATVLEQMTSQMGQITMPLPEEPVGPGAVWEARSTLEISGVTSNQVATYTLESIDGEELELAVALEQTMQPGAIAGGEIISGEASTTGSTTVSLHQIAPARSIVDATTEMVMEAMGQEMTMDMVMRMDLTSTVD